MHRTEHSRPAGRRHALLLAFGAVALAVLFVVTLAPVGRASGVNTSYCSSSPAKFLARADVPNGSVRLVSVHWIATYHEDFGKLGYWAIDNFTAVLKVWQVSTSHFYAQLQYNGTWHTYVGALSPGSGDHEFLSKGGPFAAGINLTFSGTYAPKLNVTGKIGPFAYNGSVADVLNGRYANQTGDASAFNWVKEYFHGVTNATERYGFVYNWAAAGQTWCHFDAADGGLSGDIVT